MKSVFRQLSVPFMLFLFALAFSGCGGGDGSSAGDKFSVKVSPGDTKATISWNSIPGAASYNIYYSTTKGGTDSAKAASGKVENATSPYTVTGLTNGVVYYFQVAALNSNGAEIEKSGQVSATPAPIPDIPSGITATGGNGVVTVSWAASTGATSYNVYYSTTAGVTKLNGVKVANAVSPKIISGLTNGTKYYFVVTAVNAAGESDVSAEKSAMPSSGAQPPQPPKGASATPGNTQVVVTWTVAADATSYNIYYGTTSPVTKTNSTKISGVVTPSTVSGLTNGTKYYFVVTAVNTAGESDFSSEESATPSASLQPPDSPNGVTVTAGTGKVTLTWNTKLTATSYKIYYKATASISTSDLIATGTKVTVAAQSADPQPATQSHEIARLTAGTTYSFVITSSNAAGDSGGQTRPKTATPL
jgi:fibronectin type 3 domain-containing protein